MLIVACHADWIFLSHSKCFVLMRLFTRSLHTVYGYYEYIKKAAYWLIDSIDAAGVNVMSYRHSICVFVFKFIFCVSTTQPTTYYYNLTRCSNCIMCAWELHFNFTRNACWYIIHKRETIAFKIVLNYVENSLSDSLTSVIRE